MDDKHRRRKRFLVPLLLALGLLFIVSRVVSFAYLGVLYGFANVILGKIFFTDSKPRLIVSNGDVLSEFHSFIWGVTIFAIVAPAWFYALRRLGYR